MERDVFLSIVIPSYNEEKNISSTLLEISEYLKNKNFNSEIIIVDDGSSDNTIDQAEKNRHLFKNFQILKNQKNQGKGFTVRTGVLKAIGEYTLFMDADNSTSIKELEQFIPNMQKNSFDALIASRRIEGAQIDIPQPKIRQFLGKKYIAIANLLLGTNVHDFNCGFKIFKMATTQKLFKKITRTDWIFDAELLFLVRKNNLTIKEIPVRWSHKNTSKVRVFKDVIYSLLSLFKLKIDAMNGLYN